MNFEKLKEKYNAIIFDKLQDIQNLGESNWIETFPGFESLLQNADSNGSKYKTFRIKVFIKGASLENVYEKLFQSEEKLAKERNSSLKYFRKVHTFDKELSVIQQVLTFGTRFVSDREYVYFEAVKRNKNKIVSVIIPIEEGHIENLSLINEKNVRGVVKGGYVLEQKNNGVHVDQLLFTDPKGWFKAGCYNTGEAICLKKCIGNMKKLFSAN